jgi:hypothetical protein
LRLCPRAEQAKLRQQRRDQKELHFAALLLTRCFIDTTITFVWKVTL